MRRFDDAIVDADSVVTVEASTRLTMDELLKLVSSANRGGRVAQVFDPAAIAGREHLVAAYISALAAFDDGSNRTLSVAKEMMLFVAFTQQISLAISRCGAKSQRRFVLFASGESVLGELGGGIKVMRKLGAVGERGKRVLHGLGIEIDGGATAALLEAMVRARLGVRDARLPRLSA